MDQHLQKDEEGTEVFSESKAPVPVDEEQTQIRQPQPEVPDQPVSKKKSKRRILIPFMIFVVAFLGYGVVYLLGLNGSQGDIVMPIVQGQTTGETEETGEAVEAGGTESNVSSGGNTLVSGTVEPARQEVNRTQETITPVASGNQETPPEEEVDTVSQEMIDANYTALMESGNTKKQQNNFEGAKADFEEAQKLKVNAEVVRLIDECDLAIRKTLFEIYTPFGNLTIAKEIATGKWGAIDNQWNPIIPCEYTSSHPSGNRRAFRRDDGTYDHYDTSGKCVLPREKSY
jgi:hypothetical protein